MSKISSWLSLSLVGIAMLLLNAAPGHAQNARSWVSRAGSDANACTYAAPCATFAAALAQTNAGGTINCLDPIDPGSFFIQKSITIDCTGTFAGILGPSLGIAIDVFASATDVVRLRGLSLEGAGSGRYGITSRQVGVLRIEQCKITGFLEFGVIHTAPSGVGTELYVSDSVISENGASFQGSGIFIEAQNTGTARVSLSNVKLDNNYNGLFVQADPGSTGRISLSMRDSTATGNSNIGIEIASQGAPVVAALDNVTATANSTGLLALGAATRVLITRLTAIANFIGIGTFASGVIVSYGDNHINNNISVNGTPTVLQTPQ
jgi:hypothetical protein